MIFDVKVNAEIVGELERLLTRARRGELMAIAAVAIDKQGDGDGVIKVMPQSILIPAIIGSINMIANDLSALHREESRRRAGG